MARNQVQNLSVADEAAQLVHQAFSDAELGTEQRRHVKNDVAVDVNTHWLILVLMQLPIVVQMTSTV